MPGCCGGRGLPESIADKPSPKFHPVYLVSVCLPQNVNCLSIVFQLGSSRSLAEFRSHPSYLSLLLDLEATQQARRAEAEQRRQQQEEQRKKMAAAMEETEIQISADLSSKLEVVG